MAYNNGFPVGYQPSLWSYPQWYQAQVPPQQNQQPMQQQPQQPQNTGMTWVQGIGGAKSYLVAPNATVTLWDSEAPVIYLKSADASGMPSMKILDYTIRDAQQTPAAPIENETVYATKEDIASIRDELGQIMNRLNASHYRSYKNDRRDKNE